MPIRFSRPVQLHDVNWLPRSVFIIPGGPKRWTAVLKARAVAREIGMTFERDARRGQQGPAAVRDDLLQGRRAERGRTRVSAVDIRAAGSTHSTMILAFRHFLGEDVLTVWLAHPDLRDAVPTAL